MKRKRFVHIMVESALLIALSTVLSLIKIYKLPLGGSVTLLSMLPVCMISIRHGLKWGFGASFLYACIQLALDLAEVLSWGLSVRMLVGCLLFDYIVPFTLLGAAGCLRRFGEWGVYIGLSVAFILRFASHFVSGYVIFRFFDQFELFGKLFENRPMLYSIAYNGTFLLPELVITLVCTVILMRVPYMRRNVFNIRPKTAL